MPKYDVIKLRTTTKQFAHLHETIDRTRTKTTEVYVDKTALNNLLMDHSKLNGLAADLGAVLVPAPAPRPKLGKTQRKRKRPRL